MNIGEIDAWWSLVHICKKCTFLLEKFCISSGTCWLVFVCVNIWNGMFSYLWSLSRQQYRVHSFPVDVIYLACFPLQLTFLRNSQYFWGESKLWGAKRDNFVQLYIYGNKKYIYVNQKYMYGNQNMYRAFKNIYMATKIYIRQRKIYIWQWKIYIWQWKYIYTATKNIYIWQRKYIYGNEKYIYGNDCARIHHCQQSLPHWKWADNSAVNSRIYSRVGSKL